MACRSTMARCAVSGAGGFRKTEAAFTSALAAKMARRCGFLSAFPMVAGSWRGYLSKATARPSEVAKRASERRA